MWKSARLISMDDNLPEIAQWAIADALSEIRWELDQSDPGT
ncbi:hypothetical protein [Williamsia soli]|nr:hypothetical protein [Williamsia soli]